MIGLSMRQIVTAFLALTSISAFGIPQIAVENNKTYRQTGPRTLQYRGGSLTFRINDGSWTESCPRSFPPDTPIPPSIPCPPGHNALISARIGDRYEDIVTLWTRVESVDEASGVPARLPEQIELVAAPITDLPRPSRDFRDRSVVILHDLQTNQFREKDISTYFSTRLYQPVLIDSNSDGIITPIERAAFEISAAQIDRQQTRETIIRTGNSNGYLFRYPNLAWINAFKGEDPSLAPRVDIAVSQFKIVEAWPGQGARAGEVNVGEGFYFTSLAGIGTDYDGDPALLIDPRDPPLISWNGIDLTNTLPSLDQLFVQVFENRYAEDGTPLAADTAFDITALTLGSPTQPNSITLVVQPQFQPAIDELILLEESTDSSYIQNSEQVRIFNTGFPQLDGQRFFAGRTNQPDDATYSQQIQLYNDVFLTEEVDLSSFAGLTTGQIVPETEGVANFSIWPWDFVQGFFGGELLLPNVFQNGYQLPDFALTPPVFGFGPRSLSDLTTSTGGIARNDLIFRLRFKRGGVATTGLFGVGDISQRDFEFELCLIDSSKGAHALFTKTQEENGKSSNKIAQGDPNGTYVPEGDFDGDGRSNFYEFAFDSNGSFDEVIPSMFDATKVVQPNVEVKINADGFCELSIAKRPNVRESIIYYFEKVSLNEAPNVEITAESDGWEVVTDNHLQLVLRSTAPVSGTELFCACAKENDFEEQLAIEAGASE